MNPRRYSNGTGRTIQLSTEAGSFPRSKPTLNKAYQLLPQVGRNEVKRPRSSRDDHLGFSAAPPRGAWQGESWRAAWLGTSGAAPAAGHDRRHAVRSPPRWGSIATLAAGRSPRRPHAHGAAKIVSAQAPALAAPAIRDPWAPLLMATPGPRRPGWPTAGILWPPIAATRLRGAIAVLGEPDLIEDEADHANQPEPHQHRGRGAAGGARDQRPAGHAHERHRDRGAVAQSPRAPAQPITP